MKSGQENSTAGAYTEVSHELLLWTEVYHISREQEELHLMWQMLRMGLFHLNKPTFKPKAAVLLSQCGSASSTPRVCEDLWVCQVIVLYLVIQK